MDLVTGTGYPDDLDYPNLPSTVVEVTDGEFAASQEAPAGSTFSMSNGVLVITPPAPPSDAALLAQAKAVQIALMNASYQAAITAPVIFTTSAGTTASFAQDATSKANLTNALLGSEKAQTWPLNLWLNVSGQPVTPFTYADLQSLAAAMEAAELPDYTELLTLIGQISAATTVAAVQAIIWS